MASPRVLDVETYPEPWDGRRKGNKEHKRAERRPGEGGGSLDMVSPVAQRQMFEKHFEFKIVRIHVEEARKHVNKHTNNQQTHTNTHTRMSRVM